jgi:putative nucleotidyltransferase with HDIG domain
MSSSKPLSVYIYIVSILGWLVCLGFFWFPPSDWAGVLIFTAMASIASLLDVEVYAGSRGRISMAYVVALASIVLFGPLAGAFSLFISALLTLLANITIRRSEVFSTTLLRRTSFNTAMLILASAASGWVYYGLGGAFGIDLAWQTLALQFIPLTLAVMVNVVVNLGLLMGVISLQSGRNVWEIWRTEFRWSMPVTIVAGVIGAAILSLAYRMFGLIGLLVFLLPILAISYSFQVYVRNTKVYLEKLEALNQELASMNTQLDRANFGLLETLGAVIDAYDIYTYGHSKQVATYIDALAEALKVEGEERKALVRAALVHDIGKIAIEDSIIGKQGRLTEAEYNMVKRHPKIGAQILSQMKELRDLVPVVEAHHERWDGKGYPNRLAGEAIPFGARILAVADSLDAMISDRPYRPTRDFASVQAEIIQQAGSQFDPQVVEAFCQVVVVKGEGFFRNSAVAVEDALNLAQIYKGRAGGHYLKKGMLDMVAPLPETDVDTPAPAD